MLSWQIGSSTGCCWQATIFDCLPEVREHGFDLIEICSHPGHLDYHNLSVVHRAASTIQSLGLTAHSFHAPFSEEIDITSLEGHVRAAAARELTAAADAAAALQVTYFVVHPGPEKRAFPDDERLTLLNHAATALDRVYEHCKTLGVKLLLENMLAHLFAGRMENLLWILDALRGRDIGICLDTGHAQLARNLPKMVAMSAPYLKLVHASDNRGHWDDHLPPGDGQIDWAALLGELGELHYDGAIILEIAGMKDQKAALDRACRGRNYLQHVAAAVESPIR